MHSEIVEIKFNITTQKFLIIESFPNEILCTLGVALQKFLVRSCYEEIYELATAEMLSSKCEISDGVVALPTFLFTGVPGIGKSVFMIYFLCRYSRDDRFSDKRFAAEFHKGEYLYYSPAEVSGKYFFSRKISLHILQNILLVADMGEATEPKFNAKYTLIFSSPNPARSKKFIDKNYGTRYTLPTWTENELCLVKPDIESWYHRFVIFGGVARPVFWVKKTVQDLRNEIMSKGGDIATKFFKNGFGWVDTQMSYTLVHINPPRDAEDRYMYSDSNLVYTFASDFAFKELSEHYRIGLLAEAAALFNAGGDIACNTLGGASAGNLFEKLCLWLAPLAGSTISCVTLENNVDTFKFAVPKYEILNRNWKEEHNLVSGVLYQPSVSNMEAGDAFCVLLINGVYSLIVFQMTVAEIHPIKANGLTYIYHAFAESIKNQIVRKIVVFVTPIDGKLWTKQQIHTQGRTVFKRDQDIPIEARNFEQWVYRHFVVSLNI